MNISNKQRDWKKISLWKDVTDEQWNDWIWQLTHTIKTLEDLNKVINLTKDEVEGIKNATSTIPLNITPYFASLMDPDDPTCPIRMQAVPISMEIDYKKFESEDPLSEDKDSPVLGITHRYPDRVLFLVTNQCSMYCRYCTRRRFSGQVGMAVPKKQLNIGIDYIKNNKNIRDVLLSGGDALLINNKILEYILSELRKIPHVEIIRIGTRAPVVFPQRITKELCDMIQKYHPVWVNTHFNTSLEITNDSFEACTKLINAGIPVGNQSVLLKGVNDNIEIMKKLLQDLIYMRVRPYYIYQCDLSEGISHFRTPISKGIEIMEGLIGHTTGFAIPRFVIDAPGGGGKIPINPNYLLSQSTESVILRNFEGNIVSYPECNEYTPDTALPYFKKYYEVSDNNYYKSVHSLNKNIPNSLITNENHRYMTREKYKQDYMHKTLEDIRRTNQ